MENAIENREVAPIVIPPAKNWAQTVSITDLFLLLLKLSVAALPFVIAALFFLPTFLEGYLTFMAHATGQAIR